MKNPLFYKIKKKQLTLVTGPQFQVLPKPPPTATALFFTLLPCPQYFFFYLLSFLFLPFLLHFLLLLPRKFQLVLGGYHLVSFITAGSIPRK
jgi:hypothetical protein